MLNDIISVLILNKLFCIQVQFLQYWCSLLGCAVFENSLNDTAAIWVSAQSKYLTVKCINDELKSRRVDALDALLNNVVPILIFYAYNFFFSGER